MNRAVASQTANEAQFFSQQNQTNLMQAIVDDVTNSYGQLDTREQNRLARTLDHYMNEVWDTNGPMPLATLNRETLTAASSDFVSYLRRSNIQMTVPPQQQPLRTQPSALTTTVQNLQRPTYDTNVDSRLSLDTSSRFEQLQQERTGGSGAAKRPTVPDFRIPIENESIPAVNLFEQIKKQREEEAARGATAAVNSSDVMAPTERQQNLFRPAIADDPNVNMTLALPSVPPTVNPITRTSAQDILIKQDPIIAYKEIENNLFVYSADRDWVNNTRDTRYNFTVNFQSGNNGQGFAFGPTSQEKFKNIVRIELVKAIIPTEGLETLLVNTAANGATPVFDTTTRLNVLGYPYLTLRIPELDTNNYGTNNNLDNSFGVLQYDANWISDSTSSNVDSRGYLAMIPKFMKAQKVYSPTPLATLTKLTIQMDKPDGNPLSVLPDTVQIAQVFASKSMLSGTTSASKYIHTAAIDSATNSDYYILYTGQSNYFSRFAISPGDRIQVGGLTTSLYPAANAVAANDMIGYLQQSGGLSVVAIGYLNSSSVWTDGPNPVGYANFIVVRAPFVDPTTGSVLVQPFGGSTTANTSLASALATATATASISGVRAINLSHQVQIAFRVITRELDPTSQVRPDNL